MTARELLAGLPFSPKELLTLEIALNTEWWRGYFAGIDEQKADGKS